MASPAINSARPVVLVVDDEPVALAVLQRTLEPHYHVLTASDGLEALTIIGGAGLGHPGSGHRRADASAVRARPGGTLGALGPLSRHPVRLGLYRPGRAGHALAKLFPPDALLGAVSRLLESQDRSGSRPE